MIKFLYSTILIFIYSALVFSAESISSPDTSVSSNGKLATYTNTMDESKIKSHDPAVTGPAPASQLIHYFPDIKKIIERETLNIGVNTFSSNEPFIIKSKDGKSYSGLDIEIAEDFCRCIGVKPVFNYKATNIRQLFDMISTGEVDIAVGDLSRSFERMKYVYFSDEYATLYQSIVMNNSDLIKLNISDNPYSYLAANEVKIGVESETAYVEFAQLDFPKAIIIKYPPGDSGEYELRDHKIFAAFGDSNEVLLIAKRNPEVALSFTIFVFTDLTITKGIAISPQNPNLLSIVNSYLAMHDVFYELQDLVEKYPEVYKDE